MALEKAFIPHGGYWSSPFVKWQGSLATTNSVTLAADTARRWLEGRGIAAETFDGIGLGWTVPQKHSFYGAPWIAGLIGAPGISGPMYMQACATSARLLAGSAHEVETGFRECVLGLAFDRCSNGPHVVYPNPGAPGGTADAENWVWDNFGHDPWAKNAMIETAERVAKEHGISREEQDDCALMRFEQYQAALADDRAFQRRWMMPLELKQGRKTITIEEDDGVFPTTKEGLAKLKPMMPEGSVTFGSQTHPADGNAGIIVTTRDRAKEMARDSNAQIQLLSFGQCRVGKGLMPTAPAPAAKAALQSAGIAIEDCKVVKTHNPFAVNDIHFSRETGLPLERFNDYGSPLVFGHPQGPTGLRVVVEMIEELVEKGGGVGLFSGCAAGDTAMSVVLRVG